MEKVAETVMEKKTSSVLTNQCVISGVLTRIQPLSNSCTEISVYVTTGRNKSFITVFLYNAARCLLEQQNLQSGDTVTIIGNIQSRKNDDPLAQSLIGTSIFKNYHSPISNQSLYINHWEIYGKLIEITECPWNNVYELATIVTYSEGRMSLVHILINKYIACNREFHLGEKYRATGWVRTTKCYPVDDATDQKPRIYQHYMTSYIG